jgi:SAM-dependent methyltransferase
MWPRTAETGSAFSASYHQLLGHDPTKAEIRHVQRALKNGSSFGAQLLDLARSDAYRARLVEAVGTLPERSDAEFLEHAYTKVLERPPDQVGTEYFLDEFRRGMTREESLRVLASSDEHVNRVVAAAYPLPDIIGPNPDRYRLTPRADRDEKVLCYLATTDADFDWISARIAEHNFYDRPGVWGFSITEEKRTMAKVIAHFSPATVLDLGCANGVILKCLYDLGIAGEGVELSRSAIRQAFPEVRDAIHHGDVAAMPRTKQYDLVSGFDIFEHVTPSQLKEMLASIVSMLTPGGILLVNVPAFGDDPVFGTVFELYLTEWVEAASEFRPFSMLETDEYGFPLHGHLIWAGGDWWVNEFESAGLQRDVDAELALHREHDEFFLAAAPSRRALFVFRKPESG